METSFCSKYLRLKLLQRRKQRLLKASISTDRQILRTCCSFLWSRSVMHNKPAQRSCLILNLNLSFFSSESDSADSPAGTNFILVEKLHPSQTGVFYLTATFVCLHYYIFHRLDFWVYLSVHGALPKYLHILNFSTFCCNHKL